MSIYRLCCCLLILVFLVSVCEEAQARRRRSPRRAHPVVLWAKTLSNSTDHEQRKLAAFKLSQYTRAIFQSQVIDTLLTCMKDPDMHIEVLCTKALSRAKNKTRRDQIRNALLERYENAPPIRNTVVRTLIARKDSSHLTRTTFLKAAKTETNEKTILVLLTYFEKYGDGSDKFVAALVDLYKKTKSTKIKRALAKTLGQRAKGQNIVIELFSKCVDSSDTPLVLTCLSGLESQAKNDSRAWIAVQKTITSRDPDVLLSALDVINALPPLANEELTKRLIEIIGDIQDNDLKERAVLALGVAGDQGQSVVTMLQELVKEGDDEGVRLAAALVLGKQAIHFSDSAKSLLNTCSKVETTQPLRAACGLGLQELNTRLARVAKAPKLKRAPTQSPPKKKN